MQNFTTTITSLLLLLGLFSSSTSSAQETNFFTFECGSPINVAENCPSTRDFDIAVSGQGTMGMNNTGIVEAFFDISTFSGFFGKISLVSPGGSEFVLASGEEGILSFPDHSGGSLFPAFRSCESLPYHNESVGSGNINSQQFRPLEDFTVLNNGINSADGTWKLRMCGLPDDFTAICGRITFGPICPELDFSIVPSTCNTQDGGIDFTSTLGACSNLLVNINGQPWESGISGWFTVPGEYTVCWGEEIITAVLPAVSCQQCTTLVVPSIDNEDPVFTNCQSGFTIAVDDNCSVEVILPDPEVTDNCGGVLTGTATHVDPNGNTVFTAPLSPGQTFTYPLSILGNHVFTYTAEDEAGNSTTCVTTVTVEDNTPPVWTNQTASITGQCGVDNLFSLALQASSQLTATDNCDNNVNIFEIDLLYELPPSIAAGCGETATYTWRMMAQDNSGNSAEDFGLVIVNMEDNLAPVISGIPANVTINCNENFPNQPIITAIDNCEGDISDQVTTLSNEVTGSCNLGANATVITYTYGVLDGCNNEVSADWTVTVFNSEAVSLGSDFTSCLGDTETLTASGLSGTYTWSNGASTPSITVSTSGTYAVTVEGISGCCSEDEVTVTFEEVPIASATGGTLDCSGNLVQLTGSSTVAGSSFDWSGPGGFTSSQQNPSVSQAGTYTLTVSSPSGSCADVVSTEVLSNNDVPNISTAGGEIDCIVSSVTLMGNSTTPSVTYAWTGPAGFTSTMPNPTVTIAGTYQLTVTAPNSCIAEGVAVVTEDVTVPSLTLADEEINCDNSSATLSPITDDDNATYVWSGPGGFTSTMQNPTVTTAGTYSLVITSNNGCTNTASSVVTEDIAVPNLAASGEQITCANPSAQLTATSTTTGVTYNWTGPNGFSSTIANPTATIAGTYSVTVEAPNGCNASETVTVATDVAAPVTSSENDVLDCTSPELNLPLTINGGNNTIAWTGPAGFTSTMQNPTISAAGTYTAVVTGSNGCTSTAMSVITQDIAVPNATASGGSITCTTNSVQLMGASTTSGVSFGWVGPNDFLSTIPNPSVGAAGTYTLTVTAPNGCTATATAMVTADGDLPNISATGGELNCVTSSVTLTGNSSTSMVTYMWTGPEGFSSTMQNVDVSVSGIFTLTVTAPNGCQSTTQVNILNNNTAPTVTATGGMISCTASTTTIMASGGAGTTYAWSGPGGFTSTMQNPTVSAAGDYTVTATGTNGCTATAMASVTSDDQLPSVVALGGTLTCEQPSVILTSNSSDQVTYSWTGPGGFTSTMQNPVVMVPGDYILTVTAPNGCSSTITVTVEQNDDLPQVNIPQPVVDCDAGTATIRVESTEDLTYRWTFNGNVISTGEIAVVSMAGTYDVLVTSANGCTVNLSYTLTESIGDLQSNITTTDATSNEGGTATLEVLTGNAATIVWDNGQTGTTATDLSVGIHTVTITDVNGCEYTEEFEIQINTAVADIQEITNFEVYPTAVNDGVTLSAELSESKAGMINIYSQTGQLVQAINIAKSSYIEQYIDMSETANGIYIISLHIEGKVKSTKVFKY